MELGESSWSERGISVSTGAGAHETACVQRAWARALGRAARVSNTQGTDAGDSEACAGVDRWSLRLSRFPCVFAISAHLIAISARRAAQPLRRLDHVLLLHRERGADEE
eukprot:6109074-Pleurochrysis_carterae.AAC.1